MSVCSKWERIGCILGFDGCDIERLDKKRRGEPEDCCRDIFSEWLEKGMIDSRYSMDWKGVVELLEDCQYSALADDLQEALKINP